MSLPYVRSLPSAKCTSAKLSQQLRENSKTNLQRPQLLLIIMEQIIDYPLNHKPPFRNNSKVMLGRVHIYPNESRKCRIDCSNPLTQSTVLDFWAHLLAREKLLSVFNTVAFLHVVAMSIKLPSTSVPLLPICPSVHLKHSYQNSQRMQKDSCTAWPGIVGQLSALDKQVLFRSLCRISTTNSLRLKAETILPGCSHPLHQYFQFLPSSALLTLPLAKTNR